MEKKTSNHQFPVAAELQAKTREILNSCPNRISGTEGCKRSAEIIADWMKPNCDTVKIEEFSLRPDAFLGFMKIISVISWICLPFVWLGGAWIWVAAIGFTFALLNALTEFVYYHEWFDIFFKKAKGYNVEGVLEPPEPAKQQIIIAGHHDNIWVFNYLVKFQKWYAPRIIAGIVCMIVSCILSWTWLIWESITGNEPFIGWVFRIVAVIGAILTGELFFFLGKHPTPGAGDNMIASVMVTKLAEVFGSSKKAGKPLLKATRLRFHSNDGEEAGLRGARAYVKKHKDELLSIPTYVLNIDSIYFLNQIHFLTSDLNGTQPLSQNIAKELTEIAQELGIPSTQFPMTFGGGGTDAAEFAKAGVEATTIVALPMDFIRDGLVYHTEKDTADILHLDTIDAIYNLIYQYILSKDKKIA
jgi:hypothetical protein